MTSSVFIILIECCVIENTVETVIKSTYVYSDIYSSRKDKRS